MDEGTRKEFEKLNKKVDLLIKDADLEDDTEVEEDEEDSDNDFKWGW